MGQGMQPKFTPTSSLLRASYHEAGHAVAAEVRGRRVSWVAAHPDGGRVRTASRPRFDLRYKPRGLADRWNREREAMIYFAGLIAEEGFTRRRSLDGVASDFGAIGSILRLRAVREAEAMAYGRWLYERSVSILGSNWAAVKRVASALAMERRLSGPAVRALIGKIQTEGN